MQSNEMCRNLNCPSYTVNFLHVAISGVPLLQRNYASFTDVPDPSTNSYMSQLYQHVAE